MVDEATIRRVSRYLDALGTPNRPIDCVERYDEDGKRIPGTMERLFAADIRALLDAVAKGQDQPCG
jgi:hypothetical protein